jgi:hypothetical protein
VDAALQRGEVEPPAPDDDEFAVQHRAVRDLLNEPGDHLGDDPRGRDLVADAGGRTVRER